MLHIYAARAEKERAPRSPGGAGGGQGPRREAGVPSLSFFGGITCCSIRRSMWLPSTARCDVIATPLKSFSGVTLQGGFVGSDLCAQRIGGTHHDLQQLGLNSTNVGY